VAGLTDRTSGAAFNDCYLTLLLGDSLTGNSQTFYIASVMASASDSEETIKRLIFASRMRRLKTCATKNYISPDSSADPEQNLEKVQILLAHLRSLARPPSENLRESELSSSPEAVPQSFSIAVEKSAPDIAPGEPESAWPEIQLPNRFSPLPNPTDSFSAYTSEFTRLLKAIQDRFDEIESRSVDLLQLTCN
jgi:hypothetical protein